MGSDCHKPWCETTGVTVLSSKSDLVHKLTTGDFSHFSTNYVSTPKNVSQRHKASGLLAHTKIQHNSSHIIGKRFSTILMNAWLYRTLQIYVTLRHKSMPRSHTNFDTNHPSPPTHWPLTVADSVIACYQRWKQPPARLPGAGKF